MRDEESPLTKHLADTGRCNPCKSFTVIVGPIETDEDAFDEIIAAARVPELVDFCAPWYGLCLLAAPEVQKLAHAVEAVLSCLASTPKVIRDWLLAAPPLRTTLPERIQARLIRHQIVW